MGRHILVNPSGRVVNPLLQRPLHVRKRLGRAAKLHAFANVVSAALAVVARLAWQANLECDTIAWLEVRDGGPYSDDCAAGFVAQRQRLADEDVAIAVVVIVVQI